MPAPVRSGSPSPLTPFILLALLAVPLPACDGAPDDDDSGEAPGDDDSLDDDDSARGDDDATGDDDSSVACPFVDYADVVVEAPADTGEGFGDAARAVNGVRGAGCCSGGTDVYSLGRDPGVDDFIVLRWSDRVVTDGPGVDLVVFENAFDSGGYMFMEHAIVEASADGVEWVAFPHDYTADDEAAYSPDPADWPGFAGRTPVLMHAEENCVDPFDAAAAGGDGFDLSDLPAGDPAAEAVLLDGLRFLRLTAAMTRTNPDTGDVYVADPIALGPDIDGVHARWLVADDAR